MESSSGQEDALPGAGGDGDEEGSDWLSMSGTTSTTARREGRTGAGGGGQEAAAGLLYIQVRRFFPSH